MQHSNYIRLDEGQYAEIKIDKTQPQTIYVASPLLSCFGILLMWDEKAILYHAPSGHVSKEILDQFSKYISQDKQDLGKVDIIIACSDTKIKAKPALIDCLKNLQIAHFTKEPIIKDKQHAYSIDTWGNHAEIIAIKKESSSLSTFKKTF